MLLCRQLSEWSVANSERLLSDIKVLYITHYSSSHSIPRSHLLSPRLTALDVLQRRSISTLSTAMSMYRLRCKAHEHEVAASSQWLFPINIDMHNLQYRSKQYKHPHHPTRFIPLIHQDPRDPDRSVQRPQKDTSDKPVNHMVFPEEVHRDIDERPDE